VTDVKNRQQRFEQGSKVRVVATGDSSSGGDSLKHRGKTGRVTSCKATEHPVVFLYDVVLEADETTLQLLPESCLESA
jgi:hypothetical protein